MPILRLAEMANNPELKETIAKVRTEKKRNFKQTLNFKRCEANGTEEGEIRHSDQTLGR
jgi:hypothetical protein